MKRKSLLSLIVLLLGAFSIAAQKVVPQGIVAGITEDPLVGQANYRSLYAAHCRAVEEGTTVDYGFLAGQVVFLSIPADAKTMPLAQTNDFRNVVLVVRNSNKTLDLFTMTADIKGIKLDSMQVDEGDFSNVPQLQKGRHLVVLRDRNPWVGERIGYGSPAHRSDILLVENGRSLNRPVASYATKATWLSGSYVTIPEGHKRIANLHIQRHPLSSARTNGFNINLQDDVELTNITIATPQYKRFKSFATAPLRQLRDRGIASEGRDSEPVADWLNQLNSQRAAVKLLADEAIKITNSTRVALTDVVIDGTYTIPGTWGYAFSIYNVWNTSYNRVVADANWGVFGSNCMSLTTLNACELNRFDIHCYGRDVRCVNCLFRNKQTQFSSLYGTLVFERCTFDDCIPVRIRASYNAYTPFDIQFRNCTFVATTKHHALVNVMLLDPNRNSRPELYDRCLPNIDIENMTIQLPSSVRHINIFDPTGTTSLCRQPFSYLNHVTLTDMRFETSSLRRSVPTVVTSSEDFATEQAVEINEKNIRWVDAKGKEGAQPKIVNKLVRKMP